MKKYFDVTTIELSSSVKREDVQDRIRNVLEEELEYSFFEVNEDKPWGAYYRIVDEEADRFLAEFFPGLSVDKARLGMPDVCISPKILVVAPSMRLSWQYHNRRAERWNFLSSGGYHSSNTNVMGPVTWVNPGAVVQFDTGERHRLCAPGWSYAIVAEIWQHTDPLELSDEDDIVRVADDFNR